MKLKTLVGASIFRDGGTLESYWVTMNDEEFSVTLEYNHRLSDLHGETFHRLYLCGVDQIKNNEYVEKNSPQYIEFLKAVQTWMLENNLSITYFENHQDYDDRSSDFLKALEQGNY